MARPWIKPSARYILAGSLEGTPESDGLEIEEELRQLFAQFWQCHMTAFYPDQQDGALPDAD
jgi:hypothetical protein